MFLIHASCYNQFIMDDAGISYSYARSIISGMGARLTPGSEIVEGYSNPLWTVILGLSMLAGLFHPYWTAKVLGVLLALATMALASHWLSRLFPRQARMIWVALPLALALHTPFVVWSVSGLENPLFAFLILLAFFRFSHELKSSASLRPWSGLIFFLVATTRPEGAMYFIIAAICRFVLSPREALRTAFWLWVVMFSLPFVTYHAWHYWYFHALFPNTYYAKVDQNGLFRLIFLEMRGWNYVGRYFRDTGYMALLLPIALMTWGTLRRSPRDVLPWLGIVIITPVYIVYVAGDWMFQFRFFTHYSVFLLMMFLASVALLAEWMTQRHLKIHSTVASTVIAGVFLLPAAHRVCVEAPKAVAEPSTDYSYVQFKADRYNALFDRMMVHNPSVLEVDIGAVSYQASYDVLDLVALADVHLARHYKGAYFGEYIFRETRPSILHSQSSFTQTSRWERFRQYNNDYADIHRFINRNPHDRDRLRRDIFTNPRVSSEVDYGNEVTTGVKLLGWTLHTDVLPEAAFQPFVTLYWVRSSEGPVEDWQFQFVYDGRNPLGKWLEPVHGVEPPARWKSGDIYFEHRRLPISLDNAGTRQVELIVQSNSIGKVRISLGKVRFDETVFIDALRDWDIPLDDTAQMEAAFWMWNELQRQARMRNHAAAMNALAELQEKWSSMLVERMANLNQTDRWDESLALWRASQGWRPARSTLLEPRKRIGRHFYQAANEDMARGDTLSVVNAFMRYRKALTADNGLTAARQRMEKIRPVFAAANLAKNGRLFEWDHPPLHLADPQLNAIISLVWTTHETEQLMHLARRMLAEPESFDLIKDSIGLSALVCSAYAEEQDQLAKEIIEAAYHHPSLKPLLKFRPLQHVMADLADQTNWTLPDPSLGIKFPPMGEFGPLILQSLEVIPDRTSPSRSMVLLLIRRNGRTWLDYNTRLRATSPDAGVMAQQGGKLPFLVWGLKTGRPVRSWPRGRLLISPHLINMIDGNYNVSMDMEFYISGRSFFLPLNYSDQTVLRFPISINR